METTQELSADSIRVRSLVIEAVEASAEVMSRPVAAEKWSEPSALEGMTVGALAAHLVRAAGATLAYLDRTDPATEPGDDLLTPITYFHAALDSPIHEQIKDVSATEAEVGHAAMVAKCAELAVAMRERLAAEPSSRLVGALGGRMISLDDFCRTRLIEVLTHLDDLTTSLGVERPETDPEGPAVVVEIIIGIARHLHGDWTMIHALSRAERLSAEAKVFPVF